MNASGNAETAESAKTRGDKARDGWPASPAAQRTATIASKRKRTVTDRLCLHAIVAVRGPRSGPVARHAIVLLVFFVASWLRPVAQVRLKTETTGMPFCIPQTVHPPQSPIHFREPRPLDCRRGHIFIAFLLDSGPVPLYALRDVTDCMRGNRGPG